MPKKIDMTITPRIAHYFRDVDLIGNSCPEFVPEGVPLNCQNDDDKWSAGFLLRVAVRFRHLWATFGIREGKRAIHGSQPAVCFTTFNLADLVAVRDGLRPNNEAATQYALTFPKNIAEKGGIRPFAPWPNGQTNLHDKTALKLEGRKDVQNQFRCVSAEDNLPDQLNWSSEWRWHYPGNYDRCIDKIEMDGVEGNTIPGLKLCQKKWSGIGVVVPNLVAARKLQHDILSLIDRGIVSESHFDHILVCDMLPANIGDLGEEDMRIAFSKACFDFKSCIAISTLEAYVSSLEFSSRLLILESSTPNKTVMEKGGCWLWFEDNTHRYVRALIKTGRVKVNGQGRYLASLDELDPDRDLRERQDITVELSKQLQERFGIRSSYFAALDSQCPDDFPTYCGRLWGGGYYITAAPEEEDE